MEADDLPGKGAQDAFFAVYLIIVIFVTLGENLILFGTVYASTERRLDVGLCQMCVYGLCAGGLALPFTLAAASDPSLITAPGTGENLCQFTGTLTAFLHRVSTFNLCNAYVDRCLVIAKPMAYSPEHRSIFRMTTSICNVLLALGLALAPFVLVAEPKTAYSPLPNAPICMFRPPVGEWTTFLYVDAMLSYGLVWTVICACSLGMLYIACISSAGQSKIAPINLGTFTDSPLPFRQGKQLPTAWGIVATTDDAEMGECSLGKKQQIDSGAGLVSQSIKRRFPRSPMKTQRSLKSQPQQYTEREVSNRKRKFKGKPGFAAFGVNRGDFAKEPPRKKSVTATFYDEVTLHSDGSTDWKTCTKVNKSADGGELNLRRQIKCEKMKNNRLITLSSSMYHDQARSGSYPNRRKTFRKKTTRRKRQPSRLNTKALFTLTSTLFVFTLTTLPVFMLHLSVATSKTEADATSRGVLILEFVSCVTSVSVYASYPFMMVMADKDMKFKIVQLMKRIFDNTEFLGENESTNAVLS